MSIRRFRGAFLLGTIAITLGTTTSAFAVTLYTTQTDFSNAASQNGPNITVGPPGTQGDSDSSITNGLATAAGGTDTAGALPLTQNVTGYNQASLGDESGNQAFLNAIANNNTLSLDYYLPQTITLGSTSGNYFQIWAVLNWSGGYQQVNNNNAFDATGLTAGQHTVSFDYSKFVAGLQTILTTKPSYFQLFLVLNSGGVQGDLATPEVGTVDIDNIQVSTVPEPASLALLAAGGLSLTGFAFWRKRS